MERLGNLLEKAISYLASSAMAVIVIIVFMNVFMRYVLNTGLTWSDEVSIDLFIWFIFLGGILAGLDGLHLKVDVFTDRMPPKMQKVCKVISCGFILFSMGILLIGGLSQIEVTKNNISSATGLSAAYITAAMVVFAAATICLTIYQFVRDLSKGKEADE